MKEMFIEKRFNDSSVRVINAANTILAEYEDAGYVLTLRQLYYQFVRRNLIKNTQQEYKRIGSIINDARLAGEIDWSMLEDRTRNLLSVPNYNDPQDYLTEVIKRYAEDLWADQPVYCEVWVEKDALIGVIERPCNDLRVPFFACRGYASQSELYQAGKRLGYHLAAGKRVIIFHLGDHDPSGIDMSRDNDDRLNMFAGGIVDLRRIALNADQIKFYNSPPNPAKLTDTRSNKYVEKYGDESWELDALEPAVIDALIRHNVESIIDKPRMEAAAKLEKANRDDLRVVAKYYPQALNGAKLKNVADKLNEE